MKVLNFKAFQCVRIENSEEFQKVKAYLPDSTSVPTFPTYLAWNGRCLGLLEQPINVHGLRLEVLYLGNVEEVISIASKIELCKEISNDNCETWLISHEGCTGCPFLQV